jgi:hypothetical protein
VVKTAAGSGAAPWESIELEIVRVLEAIIELRESPDYESHRLMERSPEFVGQTVGHHPGSLEKELSALQREAEELAGEIKELTGSVQSLNEGGFACFAVTGHKPRWPLC